MKVYLEQSLAGQRRGRFLQGLLDAAVANGLPETGCLLMLGEQFQQLAQAAWLQWAKRPGCVLLLLPPYQTGNMVEGLDWQVQYAQQPPVTTEGVLPKLLATEVMFTLQGKQGGFERHLGHEWADHALNTRYWKAHSNSGLVAATVLPLWSVSLLDQATALKDWLAGLYAMAGKTVPLPDDDVSGQAATVLLPHDFTVLVCCYGWQLATPAALQTRLQQTRIPLFDFQGVDVGDSFSRLRQLGWLDATGLTAAGLVALQDSPYWPYATCLKEVQ